MTWTIRPGTVDIPEGNAGGCRVEHVHLPAGHLFETASRRCAILGGQPPTPITYPFPTKWHYLWWGDDGQGSDQMTDLPCEQAQHHNMLKKASGRVLLGGLGVGLAPTLLGSLDGVSSITVVEKNQGVLDLVAKHTDTGDKRFEVVHMDLFDFLQQEDGAFFDTAFYDIWSSDSEETFLEVVIPLKQLSVDVVPSGRVTCWNEDVMRGQMFDSLAGRVASVAAVEGWDLSEETYIGALTAMHNRSGTEGLLGLDKLGDTAETNKWLAWSVPFFKAFLDGELLPENAEIAAPTYINFYGSPGWERRWKEAVASSI